ncbi:MAG: hypothetical protein V7L31_23980 [Nostoc sp.]
MMLVNSGSRSSKEILTFGFQQRQKRGKLHKTGAKAFTTSESFWKNE